MFEMKYKTNVKFSERPNPIPYNYRLTYKLSQLCLILGLSSIRGGGSSMTRIQILASALMSDKEMEHLIDLIEGTSKNYVVRYDPTVIRAMKYSIYDKLVIQQGNGKYKLTEKGKSFIRQILKDEILMEREKKFLTKYSKKLSETMINSLMDYWRYDDVDNK